MMKSSSSLTSLAATRTHLHTSLQTMAMNLFTRIRMKREQRSNYLVIVVAATSLYIRNTCITAPTSVIIFLAASAPEPLHT